MNRTLSALIMLLALPMIAAAQPAFPAEELWRCDLDRTPTAWSPYWTEDDGGIACLVGLGNQFVLVHSGEIVWESPELNGTITALCRADFGLEDGPRALAAIVTDSTGEIWEFFGEGWEEAIHHTPNEFHLIDEFSPTGNNIRDTRPINLIFPAPITEDDTSRSVFIGNSFYAQRSSINDGMHRSISGFIIRYSLSAEDTLKTGTIGSLSDYSVIDADGDGEANLFLCGNGWGGGGRAEIYSNLSLAVEFNAELEVLSSKVAGSGSVPWGIESVNYLGVFPEHAGHAAKIVNVGWQYRNDLGEMGSTSQTYYWSDYPFGGHCATLDSIEYEDFWAVRVVEHEDAETGALYALLMENDGRIRVLGVDEEAILGDLMFEEGVLQAEAVISERGVRENMLALFADHVSLYGVGSLRAPMTPAIPTSCLLVDCFPNPFNSAAVIDFSVVSPGVYAISVTDLLGREVARLDDGWKQPGSYRLTWNAGNVAGGVYFLRLEDERNASVRRIVLNK